MGIETPFECAWRRPCGCSEIRSDQIWAIATTWKFGWATTALSGGRRGPEMGKIEPWLGEPAGCSGLPGCVSHRLVSRLVFAGTRSTSQGLDDSRIKVQYDTAYRPRLTVFQPSAGLCNPTSRSNGLQRTEGGKKGRCLPACESSQRKHAI
jgi:hypothetical protein